MFVSRILLVIFPWMLITSGSYRTDGGYEIIWEDDFSKKEKVMVETWLHGVFTTVQSDLGPYPFQTNLYIHRSNGGEPVPWANTVRSGEQGVHFHINTDYSLEEFQSDWTAPHEIAHLSLPFIGRKNMWFSEGYASYMQWYLLAKQGVIKEEEAEEKYEAKLKSNMKKYDGDESFLNCSDKLKRHHDYPGIYWGGSCYFFKVNSRLQDEKKTNLMKVIQRYQQKGRQNDESLNDVVQSLDEVSQSKIFSEMYNLFTKQSAKEAVANTHVN